MREARRIAAFAGLAAALLAAPAAAKPESGAPAVAPGAVQVLAPVGDAMAARNALEGAAQDFADSLTVAEARGLSARAALAWQDGDLARARRDEERAHSILERVLPADDPERAAGSHALADVLGRCGEYQRAGALYEQALAVRERVLGPEHPDVARTLNNLAELRLRIRDPFAARPLLERALAIQENASRTEHPDLASTLHNLGLAREDAGDYQEARPLFDRAMAVWFRELIPEAPSLEGAFRFVPLLVRSGIPAATESLLVRRTRALWTRTLGPGGMHVMPSFSQGGNLVRAAGSYGAQLPTASLLVSLAERALGADHPDLVYPVLALANVKQEAGQFESSRSLFERALAIAEKAFGPNHPDVAWVLHDGSWFDDAEGDVATARAKLERARTILERVVPSGSLWIASVLARLAWERTAEGEYAEAERLYSQVTETYQRTPGSRQLDLGMVLNNRAVLLASRGDLARAGEDFERALRIKESVGNPDHPLMASTQCGLAGVLARQGDLSRALPLAARAVEIRRKVLGDQHPDYAYALIEQARVRALAGERDSALRAACRAENIAREHLEVSVRTLPESRALRYAAKRPQGIPLAITLLEGRRGAGDSAATVPVWDAVIRSRGVILDEMSARHRTTSRSEDAETAALRERLAAARSKLARALTSGGADGGRGSVASALARAREENDAVERALAARSARFRGELEQSRVGFAEVRAALEPGNVLVAYAAYRPWRGRTDVVPADGATRTDGAAGTDGAVRTDGAALAGHGERRSPTPDRYVAFVLTAGDPVPRVVPLGDGVDSKVERWSTAIARGARLTRWQLAAGERECLDAGRALRRVVWDPLAPYLAGAKRVLLVPDGALHLVSWGALPEGEGYLAESGPTLDLLTSERDLVPVPEDPGTGAGMLAVGGPDFDTRFRGQRRANEPYAPEGASGSAVAYRGPRSTCGEFQMLRFDPLPAAREEARLVAAAWTRSRGAGEAGDATVVLTGAAASEAEIKRLARGRRILHFATHGFYLGDECSENSRAGHDRGAGPAGARTRPGSYSAPSANPLLLSGLALAGANRRERAGPDAEDGILTAEEVGAMDLTGVEWAVLSACRTGVGPTLPGEGVFGLRRAFRAAGARSLVLTLWAVDDESARRWIEALYEARLVRGLDTARAVREASGRVLRERRAAGVSTHPWFWAGFVATGKGS